MSARRRPAARVGRERPRDADPLALPAAERDGQPIQPSRVSPTSCSTSSARAGVSPVERMPHLEHLGDRLRGVIQGLSAPYGSWNTIWTSRRAGSRRSDLDHSRPSTSTRPRVGASVPTSSRPSVVLPLPLSPTIPRDCPAPTSRSISASASLPARGYVTPAPSTRSVAVTSSARPAKARRPAALGHGHSRRDFGGTDPSERAARRKRTSSRALAQAGARPGIVAARRELRRYAAAPRSARACKDGRGVPEPPERVRAPQPCRCT